VGKGGGGDSEGLPKDERFNWLLYEFDALSPVDFLRPLKGGACRLRLLDGTGKNVGVWGRELDDVAELPPPESLDWGRRNPVLTASEFMGPVLNEGDGPRFTETVGRKAVGAEGLDSRRVSFRRFASLSFCGDGESSMMRTHPEESPPSLFVLLSLPLSLLRRESILFLWESQLVFAVEEFEAVEEAELIPVVGVVRPDPGLGLPVMLPNLIRGTRVCIFCSKLRTLARISDTI
jgi:hypothetical protein